MIRSPFPSRRLRATLAVAAALAGPAVTLADDRPAADAQMQAWLHREIDAGRPYWIFPAADSPPVRKLAHALLDALWQDDAYRRNLREWLAANPRAVADDRFAEWMRHDHRAFVDGMEFLAPDARAVVWRTQRFDILGDLPRGVCETASPAELQAQMDAARAVQDSTLDDRKRGTSAALMRRTIMPTPVDSFFAGADAEVGVSRPATDGFKPGRATIHMPPVAVKAGATGTTLVHVHVDDQGVPTTTLVRSDVQPAHVTALDGSVVDADAAFLDVVDRYYRGGTFTPQARDFDLDLRWRLE